MEVPKAAPAETTATAPETNDYGQETAVGGTRHVPTKVNPVELAAMKMQDKKMMAAQGEIQSSADLIQSSMGKLSKDENQKKRFKQKMDNSVAVPMLLKEHLGFVHQLPSTLQLAALIGQKYLKSLGVGEICICFVANS